jgi:hypothetical protein
VAALADWWADRDAGQAAVDGFVSLAGTQMQWQAGAHDPQHIDPDQMKRPYLVTRSLDPTGRGEARWAMRWRPALNAFAITFEGRITPTGNLPPLVAAYDRVIAGGCLVPGPVSLSARRAK